MNDGNEITLSEAAELVGGKLVGPDARVFGLCSLDAPHPGAVAFVEQPKRFDTKKEPSPTGLVVPAPIDGIGHIGQIVVDNPRLAFVKLMMFFHPRIVVEDDFRHPTVVIDEDAVIAQPAHIDAYCIIEPKAVIGAGCFIYPQVYIGANARIGEQCILYPGAKIMHDVRIGDRCIIGPGAVVGYDGFGFVPHAGEILKIPQAGTVIIGNDVEIGANSTIDRATIDATTIGDMTKIDNLVQVGHNVHIGKRARIAGQCGFAGSVTVGDDVVMGGQAGVAHGKQVGSHALVGAQAGITRDVPDAMAVSGYPAREHRRTLQVEAACQRLPELLKRHKLLLDKKGSADEGL